MSAKKYQLGNFKRYLLNRMTASFAVIEYIENCLAAEDEAANHSFHKVMIHNWTKPIDHLYETLSEYMAAVLIPVNCTTQGDITTFYTSSLNFVLKIIRHDFMFPHERNMFNIDILFNDKTSSEFFDNAVTIEDIVASVVSRRFTETCELDLSNFCQDHDFKDKKISFYKLSLLSHFKILMLRMGRDTKYLNLSKNNLSKAPLDILNFFIKGDLTAIDLSNNNIPSLSELLRVSSKIEKLWIEGNPLCEDIDPSSYVKNIIVKFPRLSELVVKSRDTLAQVHPLYNHEVEGPFRFLELNCEFIIVAVSMVIENIDGIKLNEHGMIFPFFRNYLCTPDRKTKMVVEKFLTLYFSHYDSLTRRKIESFYDDNAKLTVATNFTDAEELVLLTYAQHSRNILNPAKRRFVVYNNKVYRKKDTVVAVLMKFPETVHDPSTFTVDVLHHDKKSLVLIIDGIYKDKSTLSTPESFFQFRRTFVFTIYTLNANSIYHITNEMFNISLATKEQIAYSFKHPIRNMNLLALMDPEQEETEAIQRVFTQISQLKREEAESRLKLHSWDIRAAIKEFMSDMRTHKISPDSFIEDDDFSDSSSLINDEME